jgi:hypothetical protein
MLRRLALVFLSMVFVYGLWISVAPGRPAQVARVNCDLNVCINNCYHRCHGGGYGQQHWSFGCACGPNCLQKMTARKKEGLCK